MIPIGTEPSYTPSHTRHNREKCDMARSGRRGAAIWPLLQARAKGYIGRDQTGWDARMDSFWFWLTAAGMALAVAAVLIRSLFQARVLAAPAALADMQVYRDQLSEADRDLARGTITEAEAQRLKTEIARRLLDADRAMQSQAQASMSAQSAFLPAALALAAIAAAFLIYNRIGVPWYPDLPIREFNVYGLHGNLNACFLNADSVVVPAD